jgi:hypothetical protein
MIGRKCNKICKNYICFRDYKLKTCLILLERQTPTYGGQTHNFLTLLYCKNNMHSAKQ